ncbi:MAG: phenylalanine--tRNA ligase subunit alpha [Planctomycetota bacterium]
MDLTTRFASAATEAETAFAAANTPDDVESIRVRFLGRSGVEKELQDLFAAAPGPEKRTLGPAFNTAKQAMRAAWENAKNRVAASEADVPIDITLPPRARRVGSIHPLSRMAREAEAVFTSMGYEVSDGPHVELDEFNFGRLNIPADHPARDHQDTFWVQSGGQRKLLRTHTSSVQSRTYAEVGAGTLAPPFRRVAVGRVFRNDAIDATHDVTFTQVEGFVVDKDITVAHMIGAVRTMLTALLRRDDVEIRLRPSYFPFVEPGFEVDVRLAKEPAGSRLAQWLELLGCGLIHPKVLEAGSPTLASWQGFAFGMGLERLAMVRHAITDIRVFNGADLRSLRQFA